MTGGLQQTLDGRIRHTFDFFLLNSPPMARVSSWLLARIRDQAPKQDQAVAEFSNPQTLQ